MTGKTRVAYVLPSIVNAVVFDMLLPRERQGVHLWLAQLELGIILRERKIRGLKPSDPPAVAHCKILRSTFKQFIRIALK